METAKKGADRQKMHEKFRSISAEAWKAIQTGKKNTLAEIIKKDKEVSKYLTAKRIDELMSVQKHVGNAPKRAMDLLKNQIEPTLKSSKRK